MRFTAVSALLGLLAVQQAAADSDWQCSPGFPICSKSTNKCLDSQKSGVSCADDSQPTSGSCSSVQGMGVQNANYGAMKCNSKRSLFPRGGSSSAGSTNQKCIMQTCGTAKGSGITVNKGSGSQYSCTSHQIVVEQPTVVQITHYNEGSDQTCSYHQSCSANEVTTINNENCGQSDYHEVNVHPSSPSKNVPIGIVAMKFDCVPAPSSSCSTAPASSSPAKSSPIVSPSSPAVSPSSPAVSPSSPAVSPSSPVVSPSSTPSLIQVGTTTPVVSPSSTPSLIQVGTTTPVASPSSPVVSPSSIPSLVQVGTTTPVVSPSSTPSLVQVGTTTPVVLPSSTPSLVQVGTTTPVVSPSSTPSLVEVGTTTPVASPSASPSSPSPVIETEYTSLTTYTTLTSCPVTSTTVISGSTSIIVNTSLITSTITTCTRCAETAPAPSAPAPLTTTPGSPMEAGTASVPSPPVVYTSTPVVFTTTTEIVLTTLTTCPVTTTITPPHQTPKVITTSTVSTVISTSTSTITSTTLSPSTPSPSLVQSPSSSSSSVPSPPPAFKGCISAYYDLKGCGSNTDYDCYCKQDEVTTKVYECITNYEQDVALQAQAMANYQGLCAKYIPQHPAIITKSVELIPTPVSTSVESSSAPAVVVTSAPASPFEAGQITTTTAPIAGSPAPTSAPSNSIPSTTIPISVTVSIPCSVAAGLVNQISDGQVQVQTTGVMAPGCTTTSVLSTQLAVPQMHFATSGSSVGLAAGTPAANEAGATAAPAASGVPGVAGAAGGSGSVTVSASSTAPSATSTTFKGAAVKSSHSGVFLSVALAAVGLVVYA